MSVASILKAAGGCAGGVAVFTQAKTLAIAENVRRKHIKLSEVTKAIMSPLFPKLDLTGYEFARDVNCQQGILSTLTEPSG